MSEGDPAAKGARLEGHVLAVALAHDEGVVHGDEQRDERAGQAGHSDGAAPAQHAQDVRARQRRARDARLQACVPMGKPAGCNL